MHNVNPPSGWTQTLIFPTCWHVGMPDTKAMAPFSLLVLRPTYRPWIPFSNRPYTISVPSRCSLDLQLSPNTRMQMNLSGCWSTPMTLSVDDHPDPMVSEATVLDPLIPPVTNSQTYWSLYSPAQSSPVFHSQASYSPCWLFEFCYEVDAKLTLEYII